MMMLALIYGVMDRAKMLASEKPPPDIMDRKSIKLAVLFSLAVAAARPIASARAPVSTKGTAMAEPMRKIRMMNRV